ncbi:MAG: hybrid sensor histidine kinase/response regulator [Desulfamplus sp.]|nr:hybrid sensor histidine kinase/response regulator [Desulfamplus sp.]
MNEEQTDSTNQTILVVDDSPANIKILNEILSCDYTITAVTSGDKALTHIKECLDAKEEQTKEQIKDQTKNQIDNNQTDKDQHLHLPDIILLDIVMPGMNGYEVCRQLKSKKATANIPVIFITSKDEIEDEEMGFKMGAVDYITKPISPSIVKARVKTHLLIKHQRDLLQNSISVLHHRSEILEHKAELGMLAAGLAHDINNILFVAMMIDNLPYLIPDSVKEKEIITKCVKNTMDSLKMGRDICRGFTDYLKDIGEHDMVQLFPPLLKPLDMLQKTFSVKLSRDISPFLPYIKCKGSQIKRVIVNLFINACQAVEGQESKRVNIRAWVKDSRVFFSISDNGPGIPDSVLPHIFDDHYTTRQDGNGIGLAMVKKILDNHKGTIECSTQIGIGTTFTISLPAVI